ncbi:hypothetical protein [Microcoleus sp. POL10_C6]
MKTGKLEIEILPTYLRALMRSGDRQDCCRETALPFPDCCFLTPSFF